VTALISTLAVAGGLVAAGWGLWASSRTSGPPWLRWVAALVAPLGVVLALAGAAGLAVPGFYHWQ